MVPRRNEGKLEFEPDPATWTGMEEKLYIQLMVKEVQKGNRSTTTFSRKGWENIEQEFHERTKKRYDHGQFRNKFNQLRTSYYDFGKLLKEPGFRWDPILKNAIASESIWESYIKANKRAKRIWKKGCPMFDELGIVYDDKSLPCEDVSPLAQYPLVDEEDVDLENSSMNTSTPSAFLDDCSDDKDYSLQNMRRALRSPSPRYVKAEERAVEMGAATKEWTEASKATIQMTPSLNRFDTSPQPSEFSITKCVKCLESIEGVDDSTYIKAIKMFKDADWREMFMVMSAERRLLWLSSLD